MSWRRTSAIGKTIFQAAGHKKGVSPWKDITLHLRLGTSLFVGALCSSDLEQSPAWYHQERREKLPRQSRRLLSTPAPVKIT